MSVQPVLAQTQTVTGRIFTNGNTVIDARIKLWRSEATPQSFFYAAGNSTEFVEITMDEIRKVEFSSGEVYEKFILSVPVISKEYMRRELSDYIMASNRPAANVMLERVLAGATSFYQLIDKYGYPHFFTGQKKKRFPFTFLTEAIWRMAT